jgi:hypothetical protein
MTDVMPEQTTEGEQGWSPEGGLVTYPEAPANPHNHRFTVSFNGQGPMVVVRGNTAQEVIAGFDELMNEAAGAAMGNAWASIKAAAAVASGLGASPVPPGAPGPMAGPVTYTPAPGQQAQPAPPPFGPNVSAPQAPGFQGNPGFPPPQQGGFNGGQQQGTRGPKPRPMDWPQVYKIDVPFAAKDAFKAYREQYKDHFKGKLAWAGGGAYWVHGEVAQALAQYNPVPA